MIKSPNRKVTSWHGSGINYFQFSNEHFKEIEKSLAVKLKKSHKEEINRAILTRKIDLSREKNAPTRREVGEQLEKAIQSIDFLRSFLGENSAKGQPNKKAKEIARSLCEYQNYNSFKFQELLTDLIRLGTQSQDAYKSFCNEVIYDEGGIEKEAFLDTLIKVQKSLNTVIKLSYFIDVINRRLPSFYQLEIPSDAALAKRAQRLNL